MSSEETDPALSAPFGMYRFYSRADDRLGIEAGSRLYVGITYRSFMERWQEEQRQEPSRWWWYLIDWDRTETVLLNGGKAMTRERAGLIEASAIKEFDEVRGVNGTLGNNQHNDNAGKTLVAAVRAVSLGGTPAEPPIPISQPPPGALLLAEANRWLAPAAAAVVAAGAAVAALI